MNSATDKLLDVLDGVRETSPGKWIARCPAHDDRSPSLSLRELEDGRVLVFCFAGCAAVDVVHAVGLEIGDLFPRPLDHHKRSVISRIPAADCLSLIDHEAQTVAVIASDFRQRREIDEATWARLLECCRRIGIARDQATPLKVAHD